MKIVSNTVTTLKPTNKTTLRQYTGDFINTGAQTWEVPTEDGHLSIDYRNNVMTHHYYVRDYLGSIRAIVGHGGTLEQATDYTVTGIPYTATPDQSGNRRLHTGKELRTFNGLYHYDNHARIYDPLTGRFTTIDPSPANTPHSPPTTTAPTTH